MDRIQELLNDIACLAAQVSQAQATIDHARNLPFIDQDQLDAAQLRLDRQRHQIQTFKDYYKMLTAK